jgi:hypothetical protein
VIVTIIWQKLSSIEREIVLIVKNYWQLFSQIIGETLLIVTHIWRNPIHIIIIRNLILFPRDSIESYSNAHLAAIISAAELPLLLPSSSSIWQG